jgi:PAS domain-containing protein
LQVEGAGVKHVDALPLLHKGPLFERATQFELGCTFDCAPVDLTEVAVRRVLGRTGAGWWECDLTDNSLTWTTGVYDIFGLPSDAHVSRGEAVSLYSEHSRAVMERLRSYAIGQRTGFIMDAEIRPANGERARWMRLIGSPLIEDGLPIRLQGLKLII